LTSGIFTAEKFKLKNELKNVKRVNTSTSFHLLEVNPNCNKFADSKSEEFHTTAAHVSVLCKRFVVLVHHSPFPRL